MTSPKVRSWIFASVCNLLCYIFIEGIIIFKLTSILLLTNVQELGHCLLCVVLNVISLIAHLLIFSSDQRQTNVLWLHQITDFYY